MVKQSNVGFVRTLIVKNPEWTEDQLTSHLVALYEVTLRDLDRALWQLSSEKAARESKTDTSNR